MTKEVNLERDYFPEPPTPTSKAWPEDGKIILQILQTCFIASSNNTRFMTALLSLYSDKASEIFGSNLSLAI